MKKEDFDRLFDAAFEEAVKTKLPAPDPDPSWQKIEVKLKKHSWKRKPQLRLIPLVAAASFILGAFIFGTPTVTKAFNPFIQTLKNIQSGVVSFIFGNDSEPQGKAKTAPPPIEPQEGEVLHESTTIKTRYTTWDEASTQVAFPPLKIGYIPDAFKLNDVIVFSDNGEKAKKAVLYYANPESNVAFMITFRMLERNESLTTGSDTSAGEFEKIEVNGLPGFLFKHQDGRTSLDYMSGNIVISIAGSLSEYQVTQIAKAIK
jgi:hypothetical protein